MPRSKTLNIHATSSQFSVGAAELTCKSFESSIEVYANQTFNVSFGIVSINSLAYIQNININVIKYILY